SLQIEVAAANLRARSQTSYDNRGRVYETRTYSVDQTDGTIGASLSGEYWYDAAGRTVKTLAVGADVFTKYDYDGLGRTVAIYVGYDDDETDYAEALDVDGDTVLQQVEYTYNELGQTIFAATFERNHGAAGTGELTSSTARATYAGFWYDEIGRQIAAADWGTYPAGQGDPPARPSTPPAAADALLVTSVEYDSAGRAWKTIDPNGREDRTYYDLAGRVVETILSYEDGAFNANYPDEDVIYLTEYNSVGQLWKETDPLGAVTAYTYDSLGRMAARQQYTSDGLVGRFALDEGAGTTTADSSGAGVTATLIPAEGEPEWTDGHYGAALDFDGTNQVKLENLPVNTAAGAQNTVAFWMCWDGQSGKPFGWNGAYSLTLSSTGEYLAFNTGSGDLIGMEFTAAEWAGKWIHVAAIFYNGVPTAENVELYLNGRKQDIAWIRGTANNRSATTTAYISGWGANEYYKFNGIIDDVMVYSRALSADEIAAIAGTTYAWDQIGNLVGQTDPLGNETTYEHLCMCQLECGDFLGFVGNFSKRGVGWSSFSQMSMAA
ncbi:MAG: hypothetical protein GX594_01190, partial [Pirellulaceae bacterium]|nr:hypothetical protein [Pirellulaceae bacterium]